MAKRKTTTEAPSLARSILMVLGFPFVILGYLIYYLGKLAAFLFSALLSLIKKTGKADLSKMDGYAYEQYVADRLRKRGYKDIQVTPKSRDFGADILARDRKGVKVCFQCKKYAKPVGPKAVQEVHAAASHYGCELGVVVSPVGYTESARTLAKDCGVELWDSI